MLPNTIHPGEFLQEILSDRGISQTQLAKHIGVEAGVINLICKGKGGSQQLWPRRSRAHWERMPSCGLICNLHTI